MYERMKPELAKKAVKRVSEKLKNAETVFPGRLRDIRLTLGISQEELADLACMEKSSVSMYERGLRVPTFVSLVSLSAALQVSVGWLLGEV